MAQIVHEVPTLLRLPEVCRRTGLSRSTLYARIQEGTFPAPVNIGARSVAWPSHAVDMWIRERIEAALSTEGAA